MRTSTAGTSTRRTRAGGFTLIELGVALCLIGLFAALLVPRLARLGEGNLAASARHLRGTIKYLFNEAALTGREHRLVYDLDRGTYRAMVLERSGELIAVAGHGRGASLRDGVRFRQLALRGHGSYSTGEITTRILPTGWLEETVIYLQDEAGGQLTLRVAPLTGAADIVPGHQAL